MTPDKVKRAAELLESYDGLQELLKVPDASNLEATAGELALVEDMSEAGCSHRASVYIPENMLREVARLALDLIEQELNDIGVELPDKSDG
jgi:hypothetical protein